MFEEKRVIIKLEKPFDTIMQAYTAINDSFVFRVHFEQQHRYKVVHVSSDGKILFKSEESYYETDQIHMMEPDEVVICDSQQARIDIINLKTYEVVKIQRPLDRSITHIHIFGETKLIALSQNDDYNSYVSYYDYDAFKSGKQPKAIWKIEQQDLYFSKINNFSTMMLLKDEVEIEDNNILITCFDLQDRPEGKQKIIRLQTNKICGKNQKIRYLLPQEISKDIYLIRVNLQNLQKIEGQLNWQQSLYLFDLTKDENNPGIKKLASFKFQHQEAIHWQDRIGNIIYRFSSYEIQEETTKNIHYMNIHHNEARSVPWSIEKNPYFIQSSAVNRQHIQYCIQDKSEEQQELIVYSLTCISEFTKKQLSMQFMLHLNEDFDDDLLQDAIELLI